MKVLLTAVLTVAALSSGSVVKAPGETFELLILHNNDMHARFEQTSQLSGTCTTADREAGKCYGGFPRVAHVVKEARQAAHSGQGPPVLYLNAGDTYTGTAWFTIYKWKIAAEFVNALQPDAVSLGNNEVDKETLEISPFLKNLQTIILASNVNIKSAEGQANIRKSIIFDIQGVKVGVVGYLTPENSMLDSFGHVEYIDEVLAITEEVQNLQAQNVKIIIALGHSALAKEQEIAKEVAGIDMVIAGNKNTFDLNADSASDVRRPIVVTQQSGKQVPIIQSTAYDKYLGSIKAKFDENGDLLEYNIDPILLDSTVPQDARSLEIVQTYHSDVVSRNAEVIGNTTVVLDGESCWIEECNFGNLITDAIVYYYATRYEGERWTDAPIAVIHSSPILRSIAPSVRPADVTRGDLLSALRLDGTLSAVTMNGTVLKLLLEQSLYGYGIESSRGQFLQFSGIRAVFDVERELGSRLISAVVRCWSCNVPEFYEIDNRDYKVLMPTVLTEGRFGYSFLTNLPKVDLEYDAVTCTNEFINLRSPLYPEVAGRIVFHSGTGPAIALSFSVLLFALISFALN